MRGSTQPEESKLFLLCNLASKEDDEIYWQQEFGITSSYTLNLPPGLID